MWPSLSQRLQDEEPLVCIEVGPSCLWQLCMCLILHSFLSGFECRQNSCFLQQRLSASTLSQRRSSKTELRSQKFAPHRVLSCWQVVDFFPSVFPFCFSVPELESHTSTLSIASCKCVFWTTLDHCALWWELSSKKFSSDSLVYCADVTPISEPTSLFELSESKAIVSLLGLHFWIYIVMLNTVRGIVCKYFCSPF